jgi:hypothetical protein
MSEQHSAHSAERKALRERHSLRLVTEKEEGLHITKQPEGVFGFTGSPSSEELPLFMVPTYRCFEVHKLRGGEVTLVGYVTEKETTALVDLYPDPHGEATRLITVPLSRIEVRKPPSREEGNWMRIQLLP